MQKRDLTKFIIRNENCLKKVKMNYFLSNTKRDVSKFEIGRTKSGYEYMILDVETQIFAKAAET